MLTQPDFPSHRRRDPMRLAEFQVYTEFMNSDRAGRALYELKTSRNVPELDFTVLIENVAIYGAQVKGGQHAIHRGQWQRVTDDRPVTIPCVPRQLYLPVGVNQFCRFTSLAWTRCWAALVR